MFSLAGGCVPASRQGHNTPVAPDTGSAPDLAAPDGGAEPSDLADLDPDGGSVAEGEGEGEPEAPGSLTLATYNVHNLFDTVDDPQTEDDVLSAAQLQRKLERLAIVINTLDADVICLQELEHQALLDALCRHPRLVAAGYQDCRLLEGDHVRGIDVAVASRFPLQMAFLHAEHFRVGSRSFYFNPATMEVRLQVADRPVVLYINHLPSQLGGEAMEPIRQALGTRVRALVSNSVRTFPDALVAAVGDFNDLPDSPTLANARGQGEEALVDLGTLVNAGNRWSYDYDGTRQVLDYILAEPTLAGRVVAGSVRYLHGDAADLASDHHPLVARFAW